MMALRFVHVRTPHLFRNRTSLVIVAQSNTTVYMSMIHGLLVMYGCFHPTTPEDWEPPTTIVHTAGSCTQETPHDKYQRNLVGY